MRGTTGFKGLRVTCIVGIHPHERRDLQMVLVDAELDYDFAAPAASESVADAVDYDGAAKRVTELIVGRKFQLIETMAEEVAATLLQHLGQVERVRLEIQKPQAIPAAECAFVRLERSRS